MNSADLEVLPKSFQSVSDVVRIEFSRMLSQGFSRLPGGNSVRSFSTSNLVIFAHKSELHPKRARAEGLTFMADSYGLYLLESV